MQVGLGEDRELVIQSQYEEKDAIKAHLLNARWDKGQKVWRSHLSNVPLFSNMGNTTVDFHPAVHDQYEMFYGDNPVDLDLSLFADDMDLFDFQEPLAAELASKRGFLSAMSMGTGKTVASLAAALHHIQRQCFDRVLIVVPASLRHQWAKEIHKFTDDDVPDPIIIRGKNLYRFKRSTGRPKKLKWDLKEAYEKAPGWFFITSYGTLSTESQREHNFADFDWHIMIADEASYLKNYDSKRTKVAKDIDATYKWALTGTPIETSVANVFNIIDFVDSGYLGSYKRFKKRFLITETRNFGRYGTQEIITGNRNVDQLQELVEPIYHRVKKKDVVDDLPPLTINDRVLSMKPTQESIHNKLQDILRERMRQDEMPGGIVTYMQMVCDSTSLLNKSENFFEATKTGRIDVPAPSYQVEHPKVSEMQSIIEEAKSSDEQVLGFSRSEQFVFEIRDYLKDNAEDLDIAVLTGADSETKRTEVLEQCENGEYDALIVTPIFDMGMNLQWFDIIVNIDLPWNPGALKQRIDRLHRIGREDPVTCINLVMEGTIEEKIVDKLVNRQNLFDSFFGEDSEFVPDMSKKDFVRAAYND